MELCLFFKIKVHLISFLCFYKDSCTWSFSYGVFLVIFLQEQWSSSELLAYFYFLDIWSCVFIYIFPLFFTASCFFNFVLLFLLNEYVIFYQKITIGRDKTREVVAEYCETMVTPTKMKLW